MSAAPGEFNTICDVPGIRVGQAEDAGVITGVSVILPDSRAVCACDVRGGGPGTRETDALDSHTLVDAVDAVVLSGGSSWGLAAADGVASALKEWGEEPPYRQLGKAALANASREVRLGRSGAGFGARAGAHRGGTGSASLRLSGGDHTVGALVCVNSFGSVTLPGQDGVYWAHPFELDGEFGGARPDPGAPQPDPEDWGAAKFNPAARENTTIACIATNAPLSPSAAKRVAIMAQDGFARAIRPVHTPFDGDVVFVLSTGDREAPDPDPFALSRLGSAAADTLARAVARGVHEARQAGD